MRWQYVWQYLLENKLFKLHIDIIFQVEYIGQGTAKSTNYRPK